MPRRRKNVTPEPEPEPEQQPEQEELPIAEPVEGEPAEALPPEGQSTWTTRENFRADLLSRIREVAHGKAVPIEGGALDGIEVVSIGVLDEVLTPFGHEPIPPSSERVAEVGTPAHLIVAAYCPRCGLPGEIAMEVSSELRVNSEHSELRLKAKAGARPHLCGQLAWTRDVTPEGQSTVADAIAAAEDIINEADAGIVTEAEAQALADNSEPCPFPACRLSAEHEGDHDIDEELLP
jgi:hypothetical protein